MELKLTGIRKHFGEKEVLRGCGFTFQQGKILSLIHILLNLLHDMKALNLQNRTVALMENGSWAPSCARQMLSLIHISHCGMRQVLPA